MTSNDRLFVVAEVVWFVVATVGTIAAYTGNATPLVSPSQLPGGESPNAELFMVAVAAGLFVAGLAVSRFLQRGSWAEMGEEAGFTAEGGGITGTATLTGTVQGRPVRARTERRTSAGDAKRSTKVTYTVVETDLAEPTDVGLVIDRRDAGESAGAATYGEASVELTAVDDRFAVVGEGGVELAGNLLTGRVRETLLAIEDFGTLTVGDPTETILAGIPDPSGSMVGGMMANKLEEQVAEGTGGDATTVAIESEGTLADAPELLRRAEAVVAMADAFEDSRADGPA